MLGGTRRQLSSCGAHPRIGADTHRGRRRRVGGPGRLQARGRSHVRAIRANPCDTFITESTFGLPIYRWDRAEKVMQEIWPGGTRTGLRRRVGAVLLHDRERRSGAGRAGARDGSTVLAHGMMLPMIEVYRGAGVPMLPVTARYRAAARHVVRGRTGAGAASARGTPWMRRLGDYSDVSPRV